MNVVFRQNQLFTFLLYCNGENMEKRILDCGAGGTLPPLAIFHSHGYETYGIDINEKAIESAKVFEGKHNISLNIIKGSMLDIPFESNYFGFVYSYNAVFHMSKKEINEAIKEMYRVLKPGGLCFINFASNDDDRSMVGVMVSEGEYLQEEHGEQILHSYHDESEAEHYFENNQFEVVYKEVRKRTGPAMKGGKVTLGYVDYIVRKV